ncbi:carbon-nitrogen hydrolase family protein [Allorhizocola rhizosphaerae]|uniref:carbon-nitrogen hydrolase family protein n=1 Tax=Allorhizocola rhizosphaerae TaxID=1872709 RepID=UPI001B8B21DB|nr:carbon-nitrogen hydrolase family protein [Allorhizocola rhizosphaerae]
MTDHAAGYASIRVAAAQSIVTCDPVANGESILALMRAAHAERANLVHFPEGALSGYAGQDKPRFTGWHIDWQPVTKQLQRIAACAAELGLWVVVGSNHRLTPPNRPHNSLYVISDSGVVTRYDKRLLSFTEVTRFYTPGFDPVVCEIAGYRFGLALCIEINFPELFLEYRQHYNVDCVLFSSFSEDPIFGILARGHAAANNIWISVSVPAQCSKALPAGIIGPHGDWLDRCAGDGKPAISCVDLDRADPRLDTALNKQRPWRAKARSGDIYTARRVHDPRSAARDQF